MCWRGAAARQAEQQASLAELSAAACALLDGVRGGGARRHRTVARQAEQQVGARVVLRNLPHHAAELRVAAHQVPARACAQTLQGRSLSVR